MFEGTKAPKKLNLLYYTRHYNVVTSLMATLFSNNYYEACHVPYYNKNEHRCGNACRACQESLKCDLQKKKCTDCGRTFRGITVFVNHKKTCRKSNICQDIRMYPQCLKTIKSRRKHFCEQVFCKIYGKKPEVKDFLFMFYDLESTRRRSLSACSKLFVILV